MISKCANPACSSRFLYLHEGKLYRFERAAENDTKLLLDSIAASASILPGSSSTGYASAVRLL